MHPRSAASEAAVAAAPMLVDVAGGGTADCAADGYGELGVTCVRRHPIEPFFRFALVVSHCMLAAVSAPPHASGTTWSTSHPGHEPVVRPVAGHGFVRRNSALAFAERLIGELSAGAFRAGAAAGFGFARGAGGVYDDRWQ